MSTRRWSLLTSPFLLYLTLMLSSTANERVYLILKTTVRLSHPAPMDLILRKRLSLNIYKRQSITDRLIKKIVRSDVLAHTAVTYQVVSNIPKVRQPLKRKEI